MKRALPILLLLCAALMLCACTQPAQPEAQTEYTVTAISDELIRCLSEKDRDSFVLLFSEQTRSAPDFEDQVDAVFSFFERDTYTRSQYLQIDRNPDLWNQESYCVNVVYIQDPEPLPDGTPWHWFYELQFECIISGSDTALVEIQKLTVIRSNDGITFEIGSSE